jgi:hypothetical protein
MTHSAKLPVIAWSNVLAFPIAKFPKAFSTNGVAVSAFTKPVGAVPSIQANARFPAVALSGSSTIKTVEPVAEIGLLVASAVTVAPFVATPATSLRQVMASSRSEALALKKTPATAPLLLAIKV